VTCCSDRLPSKPASAIHAVLGEGTSHSSGHETPMYVCTVALKPQQALCVSMVVTWPALVQTQPLIAAAVYAANLECKPSFSEWCSLAGGLLLGKCPAVILKTMCLALHAAHHHGDRHLPVLDPVLKLLTAVCLLWWW
jgi:hypothetical protein